MCNHLGHFALTNLMLPRIRDRVMVVGSLSHEGPQVEVDDLNWRRRRYNRFRAYQQSKLANLLHARELQQRLAASGSTVRALAAHPGWVSTPLQSHTGNPALNAFIRTVVRVRGHSASRGAWPTLLAATADLPTGTYLGPDGRGERTGRRALARRSAESRDRSVARALWTRSVELTGTDLPDSLLCPAVKEALSSSQALRRVRPRRRHRVGRVSDRPASSRSTLHTGATEGLGRWQGVSWPTGPRGRRPGARRSRDRWSGS